MDTRRDLFQKIQPGCPFHVIAGAGHWVLYEAPDRFNATLLDVLGVRDA
jgi:pimeloyl-ACP methyl ester carboxylesterase